MAKIALTTPVGRLVAGSIYKGRTKNAEGADLVYKTGASAGQPRQEFYIGVAIPKGTEKHWSETPWGAIIWQAAHAGMPSAGQNPKFAFKITDGSSEVPNGKNIKPCDREGWAGNWVLHFSSSYQPRCYNRDGTQVLTEPDAIRLGFYVQVAGDVDFNGSTQQPGMYLNASMVALSAYGEEIFSGMDASAAGFGAAPLPAGAMATPAAGFNPAPMPNGVAVTAPPVPTPVAPNPAFLAVPGAPPAPPVPVAPVRVMLPAANGVSYESYIGAGWTDAQLVANGMMQA